MGAKAREMVVVVLHLAFWSQLGVVTRIYLDSLFQGGCTGNFGVCLTSSGALAVFTDCRVCAKERLPSPGNLLALMQTRTVALFCASKQSLFGEALKAMQCSTGTKRGSLGAYFTDLPPNMLGSWLMGLLAASSTLGLNTGKMLAILPAQHPWQVGSLRWEGGGVLFRKRA